jgi:methylglyoxal synthase
MEPPGSVAGSRVSVLADDRRRSDVVTLLRAWRDRLDLVQFIAARDTANILRSRLGLDVARVESLSRGGACELAALVISSSVSAALVLRQPALQIEADAMTAALHHVCDISGVPIASNRATAEAVLSCGLSPMRPEAPSLSRSGPLQGIRRCPPSPTKQEPCPQDMMMESK